MKTSAKGVAAIALHEGVVTKAYRDVAGVLTIGVGHTAAAGSPRPVAGMTITRQEALEILARDLPKYEASVNAVLPNVPQTVFDGAVSFHFNTGRITSATWPKLYKQGALGAAENSLMSWVNAGGKRIQGLINRRKAEADLIFRGRYPAAAGAITLEPTPSSRYDDPELIKSYQRQLYELGFDPGPIDGVRGPKTKAALIAAQRTLGLVTDGIYGPATKAALDAAVAAKHGTKPAPEPAPEGDEVPSLIRWLKGIGGSDSLT